MKATAPCSHINKNNGLWIIEIFGKEQREFNIRRVFYEDLGLHVNIHWYVVSSKVNLVVPRVMVI